MVYGDLNTFRAENASLRAAPHPLEQRLIKQPITKPQAAKGLHTWQQTMDTIKERVVLGLEVKVR